MTREICRLSGSAGNLWLDQQLVSRMTRVAPCLAAVASSPLCASHGCKHPAWGCAAGSLEFMALSRMMHAECLTRFSTWGPWAEGGCVWIQISNRQPPKIAWDALGIGTISDQRGAWATASLLLLLLLRMWQRRIAIPEAVTHSLRCWGRCGSTWTLTRSAGCAARAGRCGTLWTPT